MSLSGFRGAGWRPTAYLRFHIVGTGRSFKLRQWWVDETGHGEWRGVVAIQEGDPGWDAAPEDSDPTMNSMKIASDQQAG